MKASIAALMFFISLSCVAPAAAAEKIIFGPVRYDVKERHGKDNIYQDGFRSGDGLGVIRLQNGDRIPERSELIELTLNGRTLLRDDTYDYGFFACVVNLKKEDTFRLNLKDGKPSGFKRPPLPPRFVIMTVMSSPGILPAGCYGVNAWAELKDIADRLQSIGTSPSAPLAAAALNLENGARERGEAMRKLGERRDPNAGAFIRSLFSDTQASPEVRGEAAFALGLLGDTASIPALMNGMLDANETIRLGSTRALSLFKEEDTGELLARRLEQLDSMRLDAVIQATADAGWKPVATLMALARSGDPHVSRTAIGILGTTRDPRATELLIGMFERPGKADVRAVIAALGETGDRKAVAPLLHAANDPVKRAGIEVELADALAALGDPQSASAIADMIMKAAPGRRPDLKQAYKKLTGKEYQQGP